MKGNMSHENSGNNAKDDSTSVSLKQDTIRENKSNQSLDSNHSDLYDFNMGKSQYGIRRNAMDSHDIYLIEQLVLTDPTFECHRKSLSEKSSTKPYNKTSISSDSSVSKTHDDNVSNKPRRITSRSMCDTENVMVRPRSQTISSVPSSLTTKNTIGRWLRQGLGYGRTTNLGRVGNNRSITESAKPRPQPQPQPQPAKVANTPPSSSSSSSSSSSIRSRAFYMANTFVSGGGGGGESKVVIDNDTQSGTKSSSSSTTLLLSSSSLSLSSS